MLCAMCTPYPTSVRQEWMHKCKNGGCNAMTTIECLLWVCYDCYSTVQDSGSHWGSLLSYCKHHTVSSKQWPLQVTLHTTAAAHTIDVLQLDAWHCVIIRTGVLFITVFLEHISPKVHCTLLYVYMYQGWARRPGDMRRIQKLGWIPEQCNRLRSTYGLTPADSICMFEVNHVKKQVLGQGFFFH